jgi:non-heme chloroperoxidase
MRGLRIAIAAAGLTALALWTGRCSSGAKAPSSLLVRIRPDVALEVVDWGGRGDPVLLLAGLGHTAHVFEGFAQGLTQHSHVLGMTRRGFGASSQPPGGYDPTTRAEDIGLLLDRLSIERAVLIGHSLAGDEMTQFARAHPGRVKALVYLEAAYNRASVRAWHASHQAPVSRPPEPVAADSASPEAWQAYYARANGVRMPLAEIEAMYRWGSDGRLAGAVTPMRIYSEIVDGLVDPEYGAIHVPALAVYATDYPVTELFSDYESRGPATQDSMRAFLDASLQLDAISRDYFRSHMANGRVVEIRGAGHSLYITHAREALDAIRAFLADVQQ